MNQLVEGPRSRARYIEIVNGNHFDAFIETVFRDANTPLVGMHGFFNEAIEKMLDHLERGGSDLDDLPASQVLATERSSCPIPVIPAVENRIDFVNHAVVIPAGTPPDCP